MNLIKKYIDFKKKSLKEYAIILYPDMKKEESKIYDLFIENYIEVYYFHILQTLDNKDVKKYGLKTIVKEFDGKRLELVYDNIASKEIVDMLSIVALVTIKLNHIKELSTESVNLTIKRLKLKVNDDIIEELYKALKDNLNKENKFFKSLAYDSFSLDYKRYKAKDYKYFIDLKYDINLLNYRYLESSIIKNFNSEDLAIKKFEITLYLLSIDILFRIRNSEQLDIYFVELPSILLDNDKIKSILEGIYNKYCSENVSFLVNYNDYINHKRILNSLDEKHSFAAYVDMSHINFIEKKIETIESIDLFDYGVLDKVKPKDYETIIKYQLKGKEIFNNEFERE